VRRIYDVALARVTSLSEVAAAALVSAAPFAGRPGVPSIRLEGESTGPDPELDAARPVESRVVTAGYFATLGVPLLAGRDFAPSDRAGASEVVIVGASLARRDFPAGSPVGRRIWLHGSWRTVVGVVGDVRASRLTGDVRPAIYVPAGQRDIYTMTIVVRARADGDQSAERLAPLVRRAVDGSDTHLAATTVTPMRELVRRSFAEERYRAMLTSLFGVLAVALAAAGMFGVTSRAVTYRRRELGIRVALGATPGTVVRQVMASTLAAVLPGVAIGLAASTLLGRPLLPLLFGVRATDPVTYTAAVAALALVSLGATWLPARRAGRSPVLETLRQE
jgi:hypothetical protein